MHYWTQRGTMTADDIGTVKVIADKYPASSRIFITGEVYIPDLEAQADSVLHAANDLLAEPLFVLTKQMTMAMTRFDADQIWKILPQDLFKTLLTDELFRLGMDELGLDEPDFYRSLFDTLRRNRGSVSIPKPAGIGFEASYQANYAACIWLFDKPEYMAVPIARHFALPESAEYLKHMEVSTLSAAEMNELENLQVKYKNVTGLTNEELDFVFKLYDRRGVA